MSAVLRIQYRYILTFAIELALLTLQHLGPLCAATPGQLSPWLVRPEWRIVINDVAC